MSENKDPVFGMEVEPGAAARALFIDTDALRPKRGGRPVSCPTRS